LAGAKTVFCSSFWFENDHFTKTGSGQTHQGKLILKRTLLFMLCRGGEIFLEELGLLWAELLLFDDEVLGIDAAFTRPGVVAMLEQLQEKVEFASAMAGPGDGPMLSFVFRPEDIDASAIG
jgi:hypothetical protein